MFDITTATVVYCALVGVVFLVLWLGYDHRDHQRFEVDRRKTTFHCIRCDSLYTGPNDAGVRRCPMCGHENTRLSF